MGTQDFLVQVVSEFTSAFEPVKDALHNEDAMDGFLSEFGWKLQAGATIDKVKAIFGDMPTVLDNIKQLTQNLLKALEDHQPPSLADFQKTIDLVKHIAELIANISNNPSGTMEPFSLPSFQSSFPGELLEYLTYRYVERSLPRLFGALYLLGVFHQPEADTTRPRAAYTPRRTNWHMLGVIFGAPQDTLKEAYGWGQPRFEQDHQRFMEALARMLAQFNVLAGLATPDDIDLVDYYDLANPSRKQLLKVGSSLAQYLNLDDASKKMQLASLDLNVLPVPPRDQTSSAPSGIVIFPTLTGKFRSAAIPISDFASVTLTGGFEGAGGIRVELYPGGASISTQLSAKLDAAVRLDIASAPQTPWVLVGREDSTHLWLSKAHALLEIKGSKENIEVAVEAGADAAAFVLDFGEGDGFLNKIFGTEKQVVNLAFTMRWSNKQGLTLVGSLGLDITLAIHKSLGNLVKLETLSISLRSGDGQPKGVEAVFAVSGSAALGPFSASVESLGLSAKLTFPPKGGNLGGANLDFGFKPPKGVGLSIDAEVVKGGGYLFFDNDNRQYAGVLHLEFMKGIALTAIGLITTRLPGNKSGFSLLVILTFDLPPIQWALALPSTALADCWVSTAA